MADEPSFHAPTDLASALEIAAQEDTLVVAGGTSIAVLLRQGLLDPARLLWLGRLFELEWVDDEDELVRVGANVVLADLAGDPLIRTRYPAIAAAAAAVGNIRVRAVATTGGALVHADPRQDLLPALLVADASAAVATRRGTDLRPLAADFFRGFLDTSVTDGELVTSIELPRPVPGTREAYVRFTPGSHDDYPTVAVAVRLAPVPDDPDAVAPTVALGGVASTPVVAWSPARGVVAPGSAADLRDVLEAVGEATAPSDDERGSAAYKTAMAQLITERVIEELTGDTPVESVEDAS